MLIKNPLYILQYILTKSIPHYETYFVNEVDDFRFKSKLSPNTNVF